MLVASGRRVTRDTAELAEKELAEIGRFLLAVESLEGGDDRVDADAGPRGGGTSRNGPGKR